MDIRQQAITEYLTEGTGYRHLAKKYGVSRSTINKWVQIHQGIHNLPPTHKQQKYYLSGMNSKPSAFIGVQTVFVSEVHQQEKRIWNKYVGSLFINFTIKQQYEKNKLE